MLVLGTLILILGSFKFYSNQDIKELYRLGILLLIYLIVILYDNIEYVSLGNGILIYYNLLYITIYNKYIELLVFICTILYLYIIKEYIINNKLLVNFNSTINNLEQSYKNITVYKELLIIILLNILGIILFIQWNNSIVIFITLELQSYTVYIITTIYNKSYNSTKSGLLYFLLGSLGSILVLLGLVTLYKETGLINMYDIYNLYYYNNNIIYDNYNIYIYSYLFIIIGLLFKIGVAPFHNWLINIYANTPTIITIWISIITKVSILTVIYTIIYNSPFLYINPSLFGIYSDNNLLSNTINNSSYNITTSIPFILNIIIILSILIGAIGGLGQITIKRLIAYSGVINSGYILYILLANNNNTLPSFIFYIYQYSLTHIVWFILILINSLYYSPLNNKLISNMVSPINNNNILNILINENINKSNNILNIGQNTDNINIKSSKFIPIEYIRNLYGYIYINPYIGLCYIIIVSSLIGIPPLSGFFGKYYVLITGVNSSYLFLAFMVLLGSAISTYYYLYIIKTLIVTENSNINNIIKIWNTTFAHKYKYNYLLGKSNNQVSLANNNINISPIISIIISLIIMSILFIILGLDIINNGTHIVEYFSINNV